MTAYVFGDNDKVSKSGDTMTGTLVLDGAPPVQIPASASNGYVLTSDGSGNASWQPVSVSGYLPLSGGTMTGALTVDAALSTTGALTASGGSTLTGTQQLVDATAPSTNPSGGVDLYSASTTSTPLKIRDTAGNIRGLMPSAAFVTSTQNLTSSTTQTAITQLTVPVEASATYLLRFSLNWQAASTSGISIGLSAPAGSTGTWGSTGFESAPWTISGLPTWDGQGVGAGENEWFLFDGFFVTSTSAGTFAPTFAQTVSSTTATSILAGSYLVLERVK